MECQVKVKSTPENEACGSRRYETSVSFDEIELVPLRDNNLKQRRFSEVQNPPKLKPACTGPLRVVRLLILVAFLPAVFIAGPLYLRYRVFSGQMYSVGMSDMRLIDKASTTWCQRLILRSNSTFNAFLVPSHPRFANNLVPVSMTRHLLLDDDMKEYWGFYLLQGSKVTLSTCTRWPGASLIVIRGHKHLQECAYIGDDSSEELEEILRANIRKLGDIDDHHKRPKNMTYNKPGNMIRKLDEIKFHEPRINYKNDHAARATSLDEEKEHTDAEIFKVILEKLRSKQQKHKEKLSQSQNKHYNGNADLDAYSRDFEILDLENLEHAIESQIDLADLMTKSNRTLSQTKENATEISHVINNQTSHNLDMVSKTTNQETTNRKESSNEMLEDLLKMRSQFEALYSRIENEFNKYEENLRKMKSGKNSSATDKKIQNKIEVLKNLFEINNQDGNEKPIDTIKRGRRDLLINPAIVEELNEHDEDGNTAAEEGFEPDGFASHHSIINETTLNDDSLSELWSSFSSSEEALLQCKGLILNLPLNPHPQCLRSNSDAVHENVSLSNTITYKVPKDGFYFFVFNSENERQTNYIRVKFHLEKTIYDLTHGAITECNNATENCTIPLSFFSRENVVLEIPLKDNDSLWNEEYVIMSECEPRTAIYLICVITVPMIVIFLAFQ